MGFLTLEDGSSFEGRLFGKAENAVGEVIFNTNMVGYQEALVDPAYYGQIVVMTYPLIGNYGINMQDMKGLKTHLAGLVVRELCKIPSNWRSNQSLDDYLKECNISGIEGIDTRALVALIRQKGNLRGIITAEKPSLADIDKLKNYKIENGAEQVTCSDIYKLGDSQGIPLAVLDYGIDSNTKQALLDRGASLTIFPSSTPSGEIIKGGYKGVILSGGPGNPQTYEKEIACIKELVGKMPILGIGLGHQLLALACGGSTYKLHCAHSGSQSVKDLQTGRLYMTAQNHCYAVAPDNLPQGAKLSFVNWSDQSVEGLQYNNGDMSVQFYPQGGGGFSDGAFIFDLFLGRLQK